MSIEELFLRQIDSVDGNIEVIVHSDQPMTCISTGPFVWQVENIDRDAVMKEIAEVLTNPAHRELRPPVRLDSGEDLQVGMQELYDATRKVADTLVWIVSGAAHLRLHVSTARLLLGEISEARQWQRNQLLATADTEVASC